MTKNTPPKSLNQLTEFLPKAMKTALSRYEEFSKKKEENAPAFKQQQDACKVALAHIELLMKLAKSNEVEAKQTTEINREDLSDMMKKAHAEVQAYNNKTTNKQRE